MVEAYVLIQTEAGKRPSVASEVTQIEGVVTAVVVGGPYDVIARVTAEDFDLTIINHNSFRSHIIGAPMAFS